MPGGTVGRSLLADDPDAPFGHRLDPDAGAGRLRRCLERRRPSLAPPQRRARRGVGPESRRRLRHRGRRSAQRRSLRAQALADADALLGRAARAGRPRARRGARAVAGGVGVVPGAGYRRAARPRHRPRAAALRHHAPRRLRAAGRRGADGPVPAGRGASGQHRGPCLPGAAAGPDGDRIGRLADASDEADFRDSVSSRRS